jgi:hypothetical protein
MVQRVYGHKKGHDSILTLKKLPKSKRIFLRTHFPKQRSRKQAKLRILSEAF